MLCNRKVKNNLKETDSAEMCILDILQICNVSQYNNLEITSNQLRIKVDRTRGCVQIKRCNFLTVTIMLTLIKFSWVAKPGNMACRNVHMTIQSSSPFLRDGLRKHWVGTPEITKYNFRLKNHYYFQLKEYLLLFLRYCQVYPKTVRSLYSTIIQKYTGFR